MAAVLLCFVLILVSTPFHRRSEAVPQDNVDRALIAYHLESDKCRDITDSSHEVSKKAANDACEQAFFALDRLRLNTCHGWRYAGCKLISGQKYQQCTCLVSKCDQRSITSDFPKSFRECAAFIRTQGEQTGVIAAPTPDFQQRWSRHDDALIEAQTYHAPIKFAFGGAGSAFKAYSSRRPGTSEGVQIADGASTSSAVPIAGGSASRSPPDGPNAVGIFPCPECSRSYKRRHTLVAHMKSHETDETKCPVCHKKYTMRVNLVAHIKYAHPGTPLPPKVKRARRAVKETGPFFCDECGKEYATKKNLSSHKISHKTLETHCFHCKQTLSTRASYRIHMRSHHPEEALIEEAAEYEKYLEENPEVCETCNRRFKDAKNLKEHKMCHEGKTTCDACGAKFARRSSLYAHKAEKHPT